MSKIFLSSNDFRRAALQRLTTASFLLEFDYKLDAMYLAGYTVECALKALILHITPGPDQAEMFKLISSGNKMHYAEDLGAILKDRGRRIPEYLVKRYRRFGWETSLRYQSGRPEKGEAYGLLKMARQFYDWVEGELT